jgi:hypothetical protein
MLWIDYNISQVGDNFRVEGEWPGEVMGVNRDGTAKSSHLYKPGDAFIVNENGWLCKVEDVTALVMKYEMSKATDEV